VWGLAKLVEFEVIYDGVALTAASKRLFFSRWRSLFPIPALVLTTLCVLAGTIAIVAGSNGAIAALYFSFAFLVPTAWLTIYVLHRRRFMQRVGERAHIKLTEEAISFESPRGISTVRWQDVQQIEIGSLNVYIFVSRGVAIAIPAAAAPTNAIAFIEKKRQEIG
jgi:hypothetical protein